MGKFNKILILGFVFLISNCKSLSQKGYDALNESKYDEALSLFQRAITEDKNSSTAQQGLKTAQQSWIEKKLIEVRLLRLANNIGESESLLNQLISNENEWQVFPMGAAFSTQTEEVTLLADRIVKNIKTELENKNPIAAQVKFNSNRSLLINTLKQNTNPIEKALAESGQQFCMKLEKTILSNEYYTFRWLEKTCKAWNYSLKIKKTNNTVKLFKQIDIKSNMTGLNEADHESITSSIQEAFLKSKWFDVEGQAILPIQLSAEFKSQQSESVVQRLRHYTTQESYEEPVKRIKNVKDSENQSGVGLLLGLLFSSGSSRVTDNHDGTETVYEKKYRPVQKNYSYEATEIFESKAINGKISTKLNDQIFETEISGQYFFKADKHNENFPEIGLTPENPKIISHGDWLKAISGGWIKKLTGELKILWITRFCSQLEKNSSTSDREQIHRCAQQVEFDVPMILKDFYQKNYSITFENWQTL